MNKPYQLVVFDWEGTIADSLGPVLNAIATEARALHFGEMDFLKAREYVVLGLIQAVKKLFPHLSTRQYEQLLDAVQYALTSRSTEVCLIPGVKNVIQRLHDAHIDLAIATNKGHQSLTRAIQNSGLNQFFKVTRSAGQAPPKPCPQMLQEIMDLFNSEPSSTLMIGDSVTDIQMAQQLNVAAVGVDFYHQQEKELKEAGALAVFDDYSLLANFLKLPNISMGA